MLKCPKCGGEMSDYDPNKGSEWFECKYCDFVESINTISLRCEKAEAELEATKKENNDLRNTIAGLKGVEKNFFETRAELEAVKGIAKDFVDLGRYTPITQLHIRDFVNTIIKLLKGGE